MLIAHHFTLLDRIQRIHFAVVMYSYFGVSIWIICTILVSFFRFIRDRYGDGSNKNLRRLVWYAGNRWRTQSALINASNAHIQFSVYMRNDEDSHEKRTSITIWNQMKIKRHKCFAFDKFQNL